MSGPVCNYVVIGGLRGYEYTNRKAVMPRGLLFVLVGL
jgi:hypothetical protein